MQINKIHSFMVIALRISLNQSPLRRGSEFSRWKDIGQKPKSKEKRTLSISVDPIIHVTRSLK